MYAANVLSVKFTYYNFLFKNHDTNCIKINLLYAKGILYVLNSGYSILAILAPLRENLYNKSC